MLPMEETAEGAKCENLEKIAVDGNPEKYF